MNDDERCTRRRVHSNTQVHMYCGRRQRPPSDRGGRSCPTHIALPARHQLFLLSFRFSQQALVRRPDSGLWTGQTASSRGALLLGLLFGLASWQVCIWAWTAVNGMPRRLISLLGTVRLRQSSSRHTGLNAGDPVRSLSCCGQIYRGQAPSRRPSLTSVKGGSSLLAGQLAPRTCRLVIPKPGPTSICVSDRAEYHHHSPAEMRICPGL